MDPAKSSIPIINPEYASLFPPKRSAEYQYLKSSIQQFGQKSPIILNSRYEILDGHTRKAVCDELGIQPIFKVEHFPDKKSEILFIIQANSSGRKPNDFQKIVAAQVLLTLEREEARKRQLAGKRRKEDTNDEASGTLASIEAKVGNKAVHKVCEGIGISPTNFERGQYLILHAPEETKKELLEGKITIYGAYTALRNAIKAKRNQKGDGREDKGEKAGRRKNEARSMHLRSRWKNEGVLARGRKEKRVGQIRAPENALVQQQVSLPAKPKRISSPLKCAGCKQTLPQDSKKVNLCSICLNRLETFMAARPVGSP